MALENKWTELTEEQKAKAKACKSTEELIALASEEGIELNDDELEGIAGGREWFCEHSCRDDENSCSRLYKGSS